MENPILSLQSIIFLPFLVISLYSLFHLFPTKRTSHGFKLYPIVGSLPGFLVNRHRFFDWVAETLAACPTNTGVFRRPGNIYGVITANPANVEHILRTNFDNYPKGDRFISLFRDLFGDGMFNSNGELWRIQRKTVSFEFNRRSLRNFVMQTVVVEIQTRLAPVLCEASDSGRVLDLQDILEWFSFDTVCKVVFGVDPGCLGISRVGDEFMRAFDDAMELISGRFRYAVPSLWKVKKFFNLGSERRLRESISTVHKFADDLIRSRLEQKEDKTKHDLLSRFIGEGKNSPEFLRDIVISVILAGRETTSAALSWFFWVLSSRADVQENILDEIIEIQRRNGKTPADPYTLEELGDMQYLHAAVSESMRLYPPVPVDMKHCRNDDVLPDGTFVGKGWFVTYSNYAMGRMEGIWGKDWPEFRPERWLDGGIFWPESPFRYPVFHGGPRMCLGKDMSFIQMKSIVASVIERFEINAVDKDKCPAYLLSLTLRMKNGFPVTIKKRRR